MLGRPSQTNRQQSLITASIHTRNLQLQGQQSNGDPMPRTALHGRKLPSLMHALVHLHCGCNAQKRRIRSILHLSPVRVRLRCHTGCRQQKPANRSTRCSCKTQTQAQHSNVSKSTRHTCCWPQLIVVWSARAEGGDENRRSACSCPLLCDSATFPS